VACARKVAPGRIRLGIGRRHLSVSAEESRAGIVLRSCIAGASGKVGGGGLAVCGTEGLRKIENKERNLRRLAVNAMTERNAIDGTNLRNYRGINQSN
jgi:hypothetical protein